MRRLWHRLVGTPDHSIFAFHNRCDCGHEWTDSGRGWTYGPETPESVRRWGERIRAVVYPRKKIRCPNCGANHGFYR